MFYCASFLQVVKLQQSNFSHNYKLVINIVYTRFEMAVAWNVKIIHKFYKSTEERIIETEKLCIWFSLSG
jgi:hypothetical protein